MNQQGKGLPVYIGRYNLRGYGLGGTIISNIFKYAIPLLKPIAKQILVRAKNEAYRTGSDIAQDVFVKKIPPKRAIKTRGKEAFKRVASDIKKQTGSGKRSRTTIRDIFAKQAKKRKSGESTKKKAKKKRTQ